MKAKHEQQAINNHQPTDEEILAAFVQEEGEQDPEFLVDYQQMTRAYEDAEQHLSNPFTRLRAAFGSTAAQEAIREAKLTQLQLDTISSVPLPETPLITKAHTRQQREYEKLRRQFPAHDPRRGV